MPKEGASASKEIARFWRDVCIAGGQVTFGIIAATWFVAPFDVRKTLILILNGLATGFFLITSFKSSRKL